MTRDLLLIACLFASVAAAGYGFAAERSRFWSAVYFAIGVAIAWVLLTGSARFGPF